jgi:hypothetical protein
MAGDGDTRESRGEAIPGSAGGPAALLCVAPPTRTRCGGIKWDGRRFLSLPPITGLNGDEVIRVLLPSRAVDPSGGVESTSAPSPFASTTRTPGSVPSATAGVAGCATTIATGNRLF